MGNGVEKGVTKNEAAGSKVVADRRAIDGHPGLSAVDVFRHSAH
jgi:hypothetical protein